LSLTKDELYIGHHISDTDKKIVGKFVWDNAETETKISKGIFLKCKFMNFQLNILNQLDLVSNDFPNEYPNEFKLVGRHFENFLNINSLPVRGRLSFYAKKWNWSKIEIRKNSKRNKMIIVPINPSNLNDEQLMQQQNELKNYFLTGPGNECLKADDSFFIKTVLVI
jgi:hypothetical protein